MSNPPLCRLVLPDARAARRAARRRSVAVATIAAGALTLLGYWEMETSSLQARSFSWLAQALRYDLQPGAGEPVPMSAAGPFDQRMGYTRIPDFAQRLNGASFQVELQARPSASMRRAAQFGIFPIYREKTQAGLALLGCDGSLISSYAYPRHAYPGFQAVPPVVVRSLLFIENRELLDPRYPQRNPAVEWDRLGHAALHQALRILMPGRPPGGSTLATQMEKYRHSPGGRTESMREKVRQMASASLRAYLQGNQTLATRQQIVVDYLNTIPLSATVGVGEVFGLGDGLWAWYGADFERVNLLLMNEPGTSAELREQARAYRQALSLLVAQRRPSALLNHDRERLADLTDSYARLLARDGIISTALRDATLQARGLPEAGLGGLAVEMEGKLSATLRTRLAGMLGTDGVYDLDRLDLEVETPLLTPLQMQVADALKRLNHPAAARAAGLSEARLLQQGDPAGVTYSFILMERSERGNLVRVQADSTDEPFDVNEQAKLDLGSSAKLRTLVTYLELVAEMHGRYARLSPDALAVVRAARTDPLTRWAADYLEGARDRSLHAMLEAAMERRYAASPWELFFTGGGLHRFANFEPKDDERIMSVREALRHSVNLPFVRLMRDMVQHFMAGNPQSGTQQAQLQRMQYLTRFADQEGQSFLRRYYAKYRGLPADLALDRMARGMRPSPARLAAAFRSVAPHADMEALDAFLKRHLRHGAPRDAGALFQRYAPARHTLNDRAYIARMHPLELWTVAFLLQQPRATLAQAVAASREARLSAYEWLFRTQQMRAQDSRIYTMREAEAFQALHQRWQRLGYPFDRLVASYATALGSSADRPSALAELMGILVNDGLRIGTVRIDALHFAAGTPFETRFVPRAGRGERVLVPEVARVVRAALADVVAHGTARRLGAALPLADGSTLPFGGKTGTGDHRFETYSPNGTLVSSRAVSRAATFAFTIGERYFGTVTAYVMGEPANRYRFTSSLPVQVLKVLSPLLSRHLGSACMAPPASGRMTRIDADTRTAEAPAPG
jgi:membrane peptidoglycan carboxypeptidase